MRRPSPHRAIVTVIAMVVCCAGTVSTASAAGTPAPAFSVKSLDGKTLRLSDFKGRPVVIDFWATWCAPCRASMPDLDQLQVRYRENGLVVVGISVDDLGPNAVRRFADQMRIRFRLALADDRVLNSYGPIRSIPTTIFINRKGEVVRRVVGYIDAETMESYTQELF